MFLGLVCELCALCLSGDPLMVGVADVSCAGTVSNLAQGMSKMQLELERVRGAEDLIRENERLRLQNRLLELRVKFLEDEYNVPVDKRFEVVQAPPPTVHHHETHKTPDSEYCLPCNSHPPLRVPSARMPATQVRERRKVRASVCVLVEVTIIPDG